MSGDFSFSKTMYVPIGHYHLVVVDNYIFAAHTGTGEAIMVDQEGTVVNRFPCARCHGSEKYETEEVRDWDEDGVHQHLYGPATTNMGQLPPGMKMTQMFPVGVLLLETLGVRGGEVGFN